MSSHSDECILKNESHSTTETTTNPNTMNNNDTCIPSSSSTTTTQTSSSSSPGEKGLHYCLSIVLIQGVLQLPLDDLKECTMVCKSISKLVRDHIQDNFWFQQHEPLDDETDEPNETNDPEKRYTFQIHYILFLIIVILLLFILFIFILSSKISFLFFILL